MNSRGGLCARVFGCFRIAEATEYRGLSGHRGTKLFDLLEFGRYALTIEMDFVYVIVDKLSCNPRGNIVLDPGAIRTTNCRCC